MRIKLLLVFSLFVGLFVLNFQVISVKADTILQTGASVPQDSSVPPRYQQDAVQFVTQDGLKLTGYVLGGGTKGVTLGLAQGWQLKSMVPVADELVKQGYQVILWDFRNVAPSDQTADTSSEQYYRKDLDVLAAAQVLRERGVKQIFMLGASVGGTSTAVAAAQTPELIGLGILSSPTKFGNVLNALSAVQKIKAPSFFAVSKHDFSGDYLSQVQVLYQQSAASEKIFHTIDSTEHGFDMLLAPEVADIVPETPYQATKDAAPLKVLNTELMTFIHQAFAQANPSQSTSQTQPRSSTQISKATAVKSDKGNNFQLILIGLILVLTIAGVIFVIKYKS